MLRKHKICVYRIHSVDEIRVEISVLGPWPFKIVTSLIFPGHLLILP